ncbi:hypothetical protein BHE74_00015537 [Ensete ventricosum]|nr:hypothetical protein GW17_00052383 [Ensete ventricosum]RWW76372.1 hypothetical protein BHE74_00015537 [Ensete ventricosum]RZS06296.1 hypothetical protein BHM03_00036938 [Ensete ventricosum]
MVRFATWPPPNRRHALFPHWPRRVHVARVPLFRSQLFTVYDPPSGTTMTVRCCALLARRPIGRCSPLAAASKCVLITKEIRFTHSRKVGPAINLVAEVTRGRREYGSKEV